MSKNSSKNHERHSKTSLSEMNSYGKGFALRILEQTDLFAKEEFGF
jgi:hypothetical protein